MAEPFVHLNLHSEFSIIDGIVRLKNLVKKAAGYQMPAVAITDQSNVFATVKFFRACLSAGIKPIFGADLWIKNSQDEKAPCQLIVLCKNNQGFLNLKKIISHSYMHDQVHGKAQVDEELLFEYKEGLIVLLGKKSAFGLFSEADKFSLAEQEILKFKENFPSDCYLEIQRTNRVGDEKFLHYAVQIAEQIQLPVVATNAVRFLEKNHFMAHETRVCVNDGFVLADKRRPKLYSDEQFLRSSEEMLELFSDIPEAIQNTVEIAKRCNVSLHLGENFLPDFPIPEGLTMDEYFRQLSHSGLQERFKTLFIEKAEGNDEEKLAEKKQEYIERLDIELDVIIQMGFPGYFLIVADFIQWAKENSVPVGPGRGSGAGSLVAYALTITDLDPLEYDLLFERFLNPERVSMPDFDIDFCMDGRDKVIDYVARTYGRDKVSQIITYGSMAAKAAIRDVGRVQGHGYGFVDSISKLIPMDIGITISKAMEQEEELRSRYENDETVHDLIDMALSLEGITRNVGKHAGGVVISPSNINDFSAIYCESDGTNVVTQFDKDDVEAVGLVKFDFLGLKTLTVIDWALKMVNVQKQKNSQDLVDINEIDLGDRGAFDVLKASDTTAVFQLESRGMKELIKKLQPDCFEDIVALVALFRPGPLQSGMVDDFIDRKHGRQKVEYPHPSLEPILQPTYGTILYQEQVMQISQVLAGYSLGGADLLRRAMGKKKPEVMAEQRSIFEEGSVNNNVDKDIATHIFDQMEKFAAYGFNKSHSAAYALVSYQTLWLKTYYRSAFMAAVLSADMDKTEKVVIIIDECRDFGIEVMVPDVNFSQYQFTITGKQAVVYGLGAIKGVGEGAIQSIVEQRENGEYKNFQDFCNRVDLRRVNRRVLETLAKTGALDSLGKNRATLFNAIPEAIRVADQCSQAQQAGQTDLFGDSLFSDGLSDASEQHSSVFKQLEEWPEDILLNYEKDTLGLYLSGHPIDQYLPELSQIISYKICDLNPDKKHNIVICGLLIGMRIMTTKRGDKMAIITLDDRSGRQEIALFADVYEKYQNILIIDNVLVVSGELSLDNYSGRSRITVSDIYDMDTARNVYARRLEVDLHNAVINQEFVGDFKKLLEPFREAGECKILLNYSNAVATGKIVLGEEWQVKLSKEFLHRIDKFGQAYKVIY